MANIIGVRFKKPGKIYFFDPDGKRVFRGQHVIVETAMGKEYGEVMIANMQVGNTKKNIEQWFPQQKENTLTLNLIKYL